MKYRVFGVVMGMAVLAGLALLLYVPTAGVGAQTPTAGRSSLPRLPDGHPDMQGYWESDAAGAAHSIEVG
jgi:hypothetical protein